MGHIDDVVLRDRQILSRDGLLTIAVGVDSESGLVVSGPKVMAKGFSVNELTQLVDGISDVLRTAINERSGGAHSGATEQLVRETVSRYVYTQTRRRPMILPLVLDI